MSKFIFLYPFQYNEIYSKQTGILISQYLGQEEYERKISLLERKGKIADRLATMTWGPTHKMQETLKELDQINKELDEVLNKY